MGASQRTKGAAFERRIVNEFRLIFEDAARTAPLQTGGLGHDVVAGPFRIECKHQIQPRVFRALEQAESNCASGYIAIAVCQRHNDRGGPTVTLRLKDFLDLVKEWKERGEMPPIQPF